MTISDRVTEIEYNTFVKCDGLTHVTFQEGLEKINRWAFRNCKDLVCITIPDSVQIIESNAFESCPALTKIEISPNNKRFRFENGLLLNKNGTQLKYCVGGFTGVCQVPDCVRQISPYAFENCKKITEIILPDSVEAIGASAFMGCSALKKLQLSSKIKRIGTQVCMDCSSLQEIVLPEGITTICTDAFNRCAALTVVKLPQTLEQIGAYAFKECTSLKEITLPSNLTVIKKHAFDGAKLERLEIPESVKEIEVMAFANTMLTELVIPETLETVGLYNFRGCPLRKVTLLGGHTKLIAGSLGEGDFALIADKTPLMDIHQSYKGNALVTFANRFLEGEELPEGQPTEYLEYIKKQRKRIYPIALENPVLLQLMTEQKFIPQVDLSELLEDAVKQKQTEASAILLEYQNKAFGYIDQEAMFEREMKRQMRILETGEFPIGEAKKIWRFEVKEDDTIRIIGYKGKETRVLVPEKIGKRVVSEIGKEAFSPTMSRLVASVKENRAKLESVTIPEGVTVIGEAAFFKCVALTALSIPASAASIGEGAISGCCSLQGLSIDSDNPNYSTDGINFCEKGGTVLISCPGAAGDYHIPETITSIMPNAFAFCNELTSITIPGSVEVIKRDTFHDCIHLSRVVFLSGVKKIESNAFKMCNSLTSIEMREGVTTVESYAFCRCNALNNIKLPASLKSIGKYAFSSWGSGNSRKTIYAPACSAAAKYAAKNNYSLITEEK